MGKGLDLGAEPPHIKLCSVPPPPSPPANGSHAWSINHLYHHAVFTDFERQDKIFVIAG